MENSKKPDLRLRKRALKSKLMSALALLLVASIMMGTSTYAWFVLSTAPEVKGMSTTVGANGSLEIALQSTVEEDGVPADSGERVAEILTGNSYVLDTVTVVEANKTWGNIVDLSDTSYGFDEMKLYPAMLKVNAEDSTKIDTTNPLVTAKYGVDGRVATIDKNLTTGLYYDHSFVAGYGVRGIGDYVAATGNAVTISYADIIAEANTQINTRRTTLASSLGTTFNNNLLTLNNVGSKNDEDSLTTSETTAVLALLNAVNNQAVAMRQALGYALLAERAYTGTYDFAGDFGQDETPSRAALYAKYRDMDIDDIIGAQGASTNLVAAATTLKATLTSLSTQIGNVQTSADNNSGAANAGVAKTAVRAAMNYSKLTMVYNNTSTEWADLGANGTARIARIQEIINEYPGAYAVLPSGAGAMADLAAIAGDYNFTLSGAGLSAPVYVTANESYDASNPDVGALKELQDAFNAETTADLDADAFTYTPTGGQGTTYGIAIDLAFRTNSAGNLLLSTNAMRVSSATDTALMGGGSTINFNDEQLNAAVFVVFMDTDDGTIYGIAKNDGNNNLVMADYEVTNGAVVVGDAKTGDNANVITALVGDMTAKYITAVVFLDGTKIEESSSVDLAGAINLQFASGAQLVPMAYTGYEGGNGEVGGQTGDGEEEEVNDLTISADPEHFSLDSTITLSASREGADVEGVQFATTTEGVTIEGTTLTIPAEFSGSEIVVTASVTIDGVVHTGSITITAE